MKEFKGKKRAKEYSVGKSSSEVFRKAHEADYLAGYNKALEDCFAPEMLEMLQILTDVYSYDNIEKAKQLLNKILD